MIIDANDIALSYVIREYTIPYHREHENLEEKARLAAPHTENRYMMDKLVVHNIITRNISETFHAYTYIKPRIINNNGRVDMEALEVRHQNIDMQDMYINEAKQTLENISYKSERATKFEIFSGKSQNAVNVLEMYVRRMHNEYIMDIMWIKLQSADLSMFVSFLKLDYIRNIHNYTKIIQ